MISNDKPMREQHGPISPHSDGQNKFRFGNYDLVHRIDVGGMGEVYLAQQRTAFGREVAIKIMRSDLVHDTIARKRFLREAEVSAHLKHDHILPLFEFGEEQGRLFLVTPYIEGGTLARRLQSGPLSLSEIRQLFSALVQAVAYIHRRGVIHRDLKPSNILLDQDGNSGQIYVRLIDFGIASSQGAAASPPLTTAGSEMGTVAYMAPERLSGIAAPSNDIYSLGIILCQMLTGRLPMAGQHIVLPQPLIYVVSRCIATDPEKRFASAEEVLQAFEQAYQSLKASPQEPSSVPPLPTSALGNPPVPVRVNTPLLGGNPKQEVMTLPRSEDMPIPPSPSPQPGRFSREDYEAPTTAIDTSAAPNKKPPSDGVPPPVGNLPRRPRRSPLLAIVSLLIVVVLLAIASLLFFVLQTVTTASVTITPQVHVVKQVFQIKANPSQQSVDVGTASIPAKIFTTSKTGSQQGQTTGQNCDFFFHCEQSVSSSDVGTLTAQVKQNLINQLTQDLNRQVQSTPDARAVGSIHFTDLSQTADPSVGTNSKTVTVTLTEQGSIEYILTSDAKNLARQLLAQEAQKLGANYILIKETIQVGSPAFRGVDNNGVVTLEIAAGGVAEYQFLPSQIRDIQNSVKGLKQNAAKSFIAQQPGVNTVSIRLSVGDTLPSDAQQIKIIPITPAHLPPVQLPTVTPVATPTT